jgi:cytochrome bd-type quinol oxidase subunit 2
MRSFPGDGWIGHWSPGIGDPGLMGWLTVAAYFLAAWLCWRARHAALESARPAARQSAMLWALFAVGLVLLGLNKQLDLQSAITEMGRMLARSQGWYANRRPVQMAFIAAVALSATLGFALLLLAARQELRRMLLALTGIAGLGCFIVIRAASFHHVDQFIHFSIAGLRMNWLLELGGIGLVVLGALRYPRTGQSIADKPPATEA